MSVAAVIVSHGGAAWLPTVLSGLRSQARPADRIIAVDTGSKDDSAAILREALGSQAVLEAPRSTSFGAAINAALDALTDPAADRQPSDPEWIWILHDDSTPAPDALALLMEAAGAAPEVDIFGPKLREWPSLRRLLEVGVTISATGRRETGLERGEYDQGQHDDVDRVLAVNTAGMLVRRSVLVELGGFDEALAVFGNDIDFGWRAAAAGHTTLVIPPAIVFHAEAAHRGVRRTPLTGRHTHYQERRAALYTLLANTSSRWWPLQALRLALGSLLRGLGFVLTRRIGEGLDELAAVGSVLGRPAALLDARRQRAAARTVDDKDFADLLAPWWLPYRHGLDFLSDVAAALTLQAQDVAERRRAAMSDADQLSGGGRPVAPPPQNDALPSIDGPDEDYTPESGWLVRYLTNPVALGLTVFIGITLVAAWTAVGRVSGGALDPAPAGAGDWWRMYAESWHPLQQGSAVPAPAYIAPLAALGTLLGGSAVAAVSVVMILAAPVGLWGAWRFMRVAANLIDPAGAPRWLLAVGAGGYALIPMVSGAWGDGRLGPVVVAAVLPWLAHASLGFLDPEADRRRRAGWRTGALLALGTAFSPALWWEWFLLTALALGLGWRVGLLRSRTDWGPLVTMLAVPPVLLIPWWLPLIIVRRPGGLLLEAGRPDQPNGGFLDLVSGRLTDLGAPAAWGLALIAAALIALLSSRVRGAVIAAWIVALVSALTIGSLALVDVAMLEGPTSSRWGGPFVVLWGAIETAAIFGALGLWWAIGRWQYDSRRSRWAAPARVGLALAAVTIPAIGVGWVVVGASDRLERDRPTTIPAYMEQSSLLGPDHGVLVLEGDVESGVRYAVRRGDGPTIGETEIVSLTREDVGFTRRVRNLVSRPTPAVVDGLAAAGIEYVVQPAPADGRIAATLDAAPGLIQAGADNRATRAWQVEQPPRRDQLVRPVSAWRTSLLVLQALALLVVAVLCGPSRAEGRR